MWGFKIVDAFCTSRVNLSGPKAAEVVLAWTLRFCSLGGVGHLVSALKVPTHRFVVCFFLVLVWLSEFCFWFGAF